MQKLVTIYLDNHAYIGDKWVKSSYADKHGYVEEHLRAELQEGWRIVSLFGFGGAADLHASGWLAVVLEK
jgi:hypothetical protein